MAKELTIKAVLKTAKFGAKTNADGDRYPALLLVLETDLVDGVAQHVGKLIRSGTLSVTIVSAQGELPLSGEGEEAS